MKEMNHYSVEIIARQKIKEWRSEAEQNRLLNRAAAGRRARSGFIKKVLSLIFRKPGIRQDAGQHTAKGAAGISIELCDFRSENITVK